MLAGLARQFIGLEFPADSSPVRWTLNPIRPSQLGQEMGRLSVFLSLNYFSAKAGGPVTYNVHVWLPNLEELIFKKTWSNLFFSLSLQIVFELSLVKGFFKYQITAILKTFIVKT